MEKKLCGKKLCVKKIIRGGPNIPTTPTKSQACTPKGAVALTLNLYAMKKITEVSEIKTAANDSLYVLLTFGAAIVDGRPVRGSRETFFADEELLKQIKVGMEMEAQPLSLPSGISNNNRINLYNNHLIHSL